MSRKKVSISQKSPMDEAMAYKTRSEGKALLVIAWRPVIILVITFAAAIIANSLGLDITPSLPGISSMLQQQP